MVRAVTLLIALPLVVFSGWAQELTTQPAPDASAAWQQLGRLSATDRINSHIRVNLVPETPAAARQLAGVVEERWNAGDYTGAIAKMSDLGSIVDPTQIELGFRWKKPRVSTKNNLLSASTRIGEIDSTLSISLAANVDASVLYCVISQQGDGHKGSWDLFVSSDMGETWANTYTQEGTGNAPKTALVPTTTHVYVAYLPYFTMQRIRLKKFFMADGSPDTLVDGTNFKDILTLSGTERFVEIAGCSAEFASTHIIASTTAGVIRYLFANGGKDDSWNEIDDDAAVNVSSGISIALSMGSTRMHGFISYADTNGYVCIDTIHEGDGARFGRALSMPRAVGMTSLSAFGDTVICTYDNGMGNNDYVRYYINYDGGDSEWRFGILQDSTWTSESGVPMLAGGQGMGVFYRHQNGASWEGRFVYRAYQLGSIWSLPVAITDYTPHSIRPAIVALGDRTWGIAYVASDAPPGFGSVMFTTYHVSATGVAQGESSEPFAFELSQNYPNPFNPTTEISGQWTADSQVRLVVYDVLGREVAVLADGRYPAGRYTFSFDGARLATGIYLCRLTAGQNTAVRKMMLLK